MAWVVRVGLRGLALKATIKMPLMAATAVSVWMGVGNAQKWHAQHRMWHEMREQKSLNKKK